MQNYGNNIGFHNRLRLAGLTCTSNVNINQYLHENKKDRVYAKRLRNNLYKLVRDKVHLYRLMTKSDLTDEQLIIQLIEKIDDICLQELKDAHKIKKFKKCFDYIMKC